MIRTLKYLNLIFFLLMIVINAIANLMPLGIGKTGDISGKYPNLFTPAPITFSIWGIIYILIAIFTVYQMALFGDKTLAHYIIGLIGPWFIISCAMNIACIFRWHYDIIWLSTIFMVGLLFSLIVITMKFCPYHLEQTAKVTSMPILAKIGAIGFDVYLGWICVATVANISVLLVKLGWNRFGLSEQFWTVVAIAVSTLLGVLFIITKYKYMSAAAIIWAFCGILIKHISSSGHAGKYPLIITVTIIGIVIILCTGITKCILRPSSAD